MSPGLPQQVIDLSYRLTPEFPLFPIYDPVQVVGRFSVAEHGFFVQGWSFDEHCGTHVDAPAHFAADGAAVDELAPEDLMLEVAVLDIRDRVAHDHAAALTPDDLLAWERRHGPLPAHCAVLGLTGWGDRAGATEAYLNLDGSGVMQTPGFSVELAHVLAHERDGVRAIGVDTPSLDPGPLADFPAHRAWLPTGRFGIENLARLDEVPPAGAGLFVGVPRLGGGSGSPARILAFR